MSILKKLNDSAEKVLQGQGSVAPECKEMTLNEFASFAADQIQKAADERESNPGNAKLRLEALKISLAVATSAFEGAKLDKFEIPLFNESAQAEREIDAKLAAIDATLDKGGTEDEDAKAKTKADADAKAKADKEKADAAAATKAKDGGEDEDAKAKAKADADAKAKADKDKADAAKNAETDWPEDLAKNATLSDEEKELYNWGPDPVSP